MTRKRPVAEFFPYADPEDGTGGPEPPYKNQKNIGFSCNIGPGPLKNHSYQASIQCWAIIGTPVKRHFMEFRYAILWRFAGGPLIARLWWYLDPPSPHFLTKNVKVGPPLTNLSGSAHDSGSMLVCNSYLRERNRTFFYFSQYGLR